MKETLREVQRQRSTNSLFTVNLNYLLTVWKHCMHVAPPILAVLEINSVSKAHTEVQSAAMAPPHAVAG